jgi:streptogramin lyase
MRPLLALLCVAPLACGGSGDASTGASASEATSPTSVGSEAAPTTAAPTTGVASTSTSSASATGTGGETTGQVSASSDTGAPPKFDLGVMPDVGSNGCGGDTGGDQPEFSYIWVANSGEGTISKIDTQTLVEHGRYRVRPDSAGSPSRTSVNLSGDVAVANRSGGITKIYADPADCKESNGQPGLQTADNNLALDWGVEECVAWYTPFGFSTQRPVAWAPGTLNPATCKYEDQKLWTAGGQSDVGDSLVVHRLNGETGAIEDTIAMPDVFHGYFGAYGGAVNQAGDFWFITYDLPSTLVRVDAKTLAYEKFAVPPGLCPYGFAVDSKGRPWTGSFCQASARFTPETQIWDQFPVLGYGLQQDADGRMWIADYSLPGTRAIDAESLAILDTIPLDSFSVKGISIDFYGYVWVVDMSQSAFRIDPDDKSVLSYDGLVGPYTYSDMTGWGLSNVANPPG